MSNTFSPMSMAIEAQMEGWSIGAKLVEGLVAESNFKFAAMAVRLLEKVREANGLLSKIYKDSSSNSNDWVFNGLGISSEDFRRLLDFEGKNNRDRELCEV